MLFKLGDGYICISPLDDRIIINVTPDGLHKKIISIFNFLYVITKKILLESETKNNNNL